MSQTGAKAKVHDSVQLRKEMSYWREGLVAHILLVALKGVVVGSSSCMTESCDWMVTLGRGGRSSGSLSPAGRGPSFPEGSDISVCQPLQSR